MAGLEEARDQLRKELKMEKESDAYLVVPEFFWKVNKVTAKITSPIMKSLCLCDGRLNGKAGLVFGSAQMVQRAATRRAEKELPKIMEAERASVFAREIGRVLAKGPRSWRRTS